MIFDDGFDFGHHMMDWDLGNWIFIIFGAGIILLITIFLIFLLVSKSNHKSSQNTIQKQEQGKINEHKISRDLREFKSQKANYCHSCGKKLDDSPSTYCPYCGVKI